ncbi:MAG: YHS domain protein [Proteobacteria bacterium]|nr:YHS domain protein [Pseudomonadota bacterium]
MRLFGALLSVLLVPGTAFAEDPVYTGYFNNLAVSGYDTVAYFTEDNAIKGSDDHEYEWQGAIWRFSNADNLATFIEEPEKYAPQFGGYCAWAVSQNKTASADPKQFHLEDGKLYLNYNANIQQQWLADRLNLIKLADQNWPKLVD